jgi:oligopeptide/dipeptide ABC transporter ATP-binding protein
MRTTETNALLEVEGLAKKFPVQRAFWQEKKVVHAVNGIGFALKPGRSLGIVGESGSGKSTTARLVLRLIEPDEGKVMFQGRDLLKMNRKELRALRKDMQMVFQDPYGSLNPHMTVEQLLRFNLKVFGLDGQGRQKAREAMEMVGLPERLADRYPRDLSGGQRQRVNIARALITSPSLVVADEPVAALDKSVQAQVLNLFLDLQKQLKLSCLFISHDLNVVRFICDEVIVMYLGRIVEWASSEDIWRHPRHPYTIALFQSIPQVGSSRELAQPIRGELPSPLHPPAGCAFHTRCPFADETCARERPELKEAAAGHRVACWMAEDDLASRRQAAAMLRP